MAEAACASLGVVKGIDGEPLHSLVPRDDHLTDAFTVLDGLWLVAEVSDDDAHLATIVGIDSSWGVEHGEAALERESAAWSDLTLISLWQCYVDARVQHGALQWLQGDRLIEPRPQVHARTERRAISRQRMRPAVDDFDFDCFHCVVFVSSGLRRR